MTDTTKYRDDSERESAKWAHNRIARERAASEAAQRANLNDIYEGYYPEEDA